MLMHCKKNSVVPFSPLQIGCFFQAKVMPFEQVRKLESFFFSDIHKPENAAFIQMHNKVVSLISFALEKERKDKIHGSKT